MSVLEYLRKAGREAIWDSVELWYQDLRAAGRFDLHLVRRNFDREAARNDIDASSWERFWAEFSQHLDESRRRAESSNHPVDQLASFFQSKRFSCVGRPLRHPVHVFRYITVEVFMRFDHTRVVPAEETTLTKMLLRRRGWRGRELVGLSTGEPGKATWVTDKKLSDHLDADGVRNVLGLGRLTSGSILELRIPCSAIKHHKSTLRAPTVLDAHDGRDINWFFLKRPEPGGPRWGRTLDISWHVNGRSQVAPGAPEAVFRSFTFEEPGDAELAVVGSLTGQLQLADPEAVLKDSRL